MAWQFVGSLAAIALLVLLAWKWGFAGSPQLVDEEEARAFADEVPGGFASVAIALDQSRTGALLRDAAGRVALVAPAGAHFTVRLLGRGTGVVCRDGLLILRAPRISVQLDLGPDARGWEETISRLE